MPYVKLTLRNLKRSIKEYAIFMLTLVLAITFIYAFNACAQSEMIHDLGNHMEIFGQVIIVVTLIVIIILGWLISFISQFIIRKRSREFGMYLLMGMKRSSMVYMFLWEQFLIGLVALVIGCLLGSVVFQILQLMVMNVFNKAYQVTLSVSGNALLLTCGYFIMIYIIELWREKRTLKKANIRRLLYMDREHDTTKTSYKNGWVSFILALICFTVGMYIGDIYFSSVTFKPVSNIYFLMMFVLLVFSVYFFYVSVGDFLQYFMNRYHRVKYRGMVLFQYRMLYHKMKSSRSVLTILTLLTIIVIMLVTVGFKFKELNDASIQTYCPFDIMISGSEQLQEKPLEAYLNHKKMTYEKHNYNLYKLSDVNGLRKAFLDLNSYYSTDHEYFMKQSDYHALMELRGEMPKNIQSGNYILMTTDVHKQRLTDYERKHPLQVGNEQLKANIDTTEIGQSDQDYIMVLPDRYFEKAAILTSKIAVNTDQPTTPSMWDDLTSEKFYQAGYGNVRVEAKWIEENNVSMVLIVYSLFYVALIFACISAAVIATHQVNDFDQHRYQYRLLHEMGVSRNRIHRVLATQIAIYFAIPLLLPIVYLVPLLIFVNKMFQVEMFGVSIFHYFWLSLFIYIILDFCYYLLAYYSCKRHLPIDA